MSKTRSVLFVCTGNSCRSVIAEGLLRKRLKELGKSSIVVRSAGVYALDGFPPTNETVKVMEEEKIELGRFSSTALTHELIKNSDLVLAMSQEHRVEMIRRFPEAAPKIFLLREYGIGEGEEKPADPNIPDPIGMPVSFYKTCLGMIKEGVERVAKLL